MVTFKNTKIQNYQPQQIKTVNSIWATEPLFVFHTLFSCSLRHRYSAKALDIYHPSLQSIFTNENLIAHNRTKMNTRHSRGRMIKNCRRWLNFPIALNKRNEYSHSCWQTFSIWKWYRRHVRLIHHKLININEIWINHKSIHRFISLYDVRLSVWVHRIEVCFIV